MVTFVQKHVRVSATPAACAVFAALLTLIAPLPQHAQAGESSTGPAAGFAVAGSNSMVHLPLVISIQDNGEGIPQNLQDHLFDAFVTSKPKGSGLGLALAAKMVDDHGGVIEFDSQPGKTVFRVMLPMATPQSELD